MFLTLPAGAESPLLLFEGTLGPGVEVGVAAWEGVVCADEGPGESYSFMSPLEQSSRTLDMLDLVCFNWATYHHVTCGTPGENPV